MAVICVARENYRSGENELRNAWEGGVSGRVVFFVGHSWKSGVVQIDPQPETTASFKKENTTPTYKAFQLNLCDEKFSGLDTN